MFIQPPQKVPHLLDHKFCGLRVLAYVGCVVVGLILKADRVRDTHGLKRDDCQAVRVPLLHHFGVNLV